MKTAHGSTKTAGIDIGKATLDVGLDEGEDRLQTGNDPPSFERIIAFLRERKIERVGVEATGAYGLALIEALREAGFQVFQHQPAQIHLYRKMQLKRAKTDVIDAVLIARFTALAELKPWHGDARLAYFAEKLLFLDHAREDAIRLQGRLDRFRDPDLITTIKADIASLKARARQELLALKKELKTHSDLTRTLDLLLSIPGIGDYSALVLIIRLPELIHLDPKEIAALVGVAPFNCDSATMHGQRHIAGGRKNIRNALYVPTLAAATRWNPDLKAFYDRLKAKGKKTKVAIIAAMRKLLTIARAVLIRGSKWTPKLQED
jgi:transposase